MIINSDCLTGLKELKTKIDICITSPPYNLGNNHHTGGFKHNPYNDNQPEEEYQKNQIEVLNEIFRVTKKTGSLFYNHKNRIKNGISISPYNWIFKTKWIVKQELIWFNGSQNFDKIRFYPMTERIYWLVKSEKTKLINKINHHDLFKWKPVGSKGNHSRAFPEELVKDILDCFPESKTVLDPYSGSGTVAVVSKSLNKNFIGYEIDKNYYIDSIERVKKRESLNNWVKK